MDEQQRQVLELGEEAVDRIERAKSKSKQPRFTSDVDEMFGALQRWYKLSAELRIPDYSVNSRHRDGWLSSFWNREPHWAGVISQMTNLVAGRGWTITGGRNQVRRYTTILHNAQGAPGMVGWRWYAKMQAISYYTSDMGTVTELGRDGKRGPLRMLYHVDPTRCLLSGKAKAPLKYYPSTRGRVQAWEPQDFFRLAANPSNLESFRGLGFCATSMAYELVKMLYAVLMHDQEKVSARMPEGLMLLSGVNRIQWEEALQKRKANLDADLRRYFGGLFVLFNDGLDQMEAKLMALSQLPASFDRETFINQTMYGYALIVSMDATEFFPVQSGALGRGKETEIQHQKAATKGAMEFCRSYQEQLQKELPETLLFEFEQRDEQGQLLEAEVAQAWADVATTLYESSPGREGESLLTREQALTLLVEQQIIPSEWTTLEEDVVASDVEPEARSRVRDQIEVRRAMETFPDEPIVRYHWPSAREVVLWEPGEGPRRSFPGVQREDEEEDEILYDDGDVLITQADVDRAIDEARRRVSPEFAELLSAEVVDDDEEPEEAEDADAV